MTESLSQYRHPEVLVDTDWVATHLNEPCTRIVESNEDLFLYETGHIPGAMHIDWRQDLQVPLVRDYIAPAAFAALCVKNGIGPDTTVLFYGDKSNWWACYALWVFRLFGHTKVKILDGGRDKWVKEGRALTKEKMKYPPADYPVPHKRYDDEIRAFYEEALAQSGAKKPRSQTERGKTRSSVVTQGAEAVPELCSRLSKLPRNSGLHDSRFRWCGILTPEAQTLPDLRYLFV